MTNAILNKQALKKIQDEMINNVLTYGMSAIVLSPKDMAPDPVFLWYVGHDPYNSADDECFMQRIEGDRK